MSAPSTSTRIARSVYVTILRFLSDKDKTLPAIDKIDCQMGVVRFREPDPRHPLSLLETLRKS